MKYISFIAILFIISCSSKDEPSLIYDEIRSHLIMSAIEKYPDNEVTTPELSIEIITSEEYECANFQIGISSTLINGKMAINVLGSYIGPICATAFGPARGSIKLDENVKYLTINNNGLIDEYAVDITKSTVSFDKTVSTFTTFEFLEYHRYPENSFALLCTSAIEDSLFCNEVHQILSDKLSLQEFQFSTTGKNPYPDSYYPDDHHSRFNPPARYYLYAEMGDLEKAGTLLKDYYESLEMTEKVNLMIIGWNNTRFRNNMKTNY